MFIHAVPDNKGKKPGYFCSLVESVRNEKGVSVHVQKFNFGYVPAERLPYLRAAFNKGNPEEIFAKEKAKLNKRRKK